MIKRRCEVPECFRQAEYLVEIPDSFFKLKTQKFSCSDHLDYFDGEKEIPLKEKEN